MRYRVSLRLAVMGAALLTACGGNGSTAPTFKFENLAVPQQVVAGETVQILCFEQDTDGPDGVATSSFVADVDGDVTTQGDQVPIALDRPCNFGVHQTLNWSTETVPPGVYHVISVMHDDVFVVETTAAGKVTVVDFEIISPTVNRSALSAATMDITYRYADPDSTPTTDIYADRDGDLATVADQYLIDADRNETGGTQTVHWNTTGVDPGTYSILFVNDDGAQGTEQFTATGRITVVAVTAFSPEDGAELPSTAYNARITFSQPLDNLGAVIGPGTIRVRIGGVAVPGSYLLEGGGTEINFEPAAGLFPAEEDVSIDVRTDMLETDAAAVTSAYAEFSTRASPVYVMDRNRSFIAVMSLADPSAPQQVDEFQLDEDDRPYFSVCASDGLLYISQYGSEGAAYVIVYDVIRGELVGRIPMPAMFGENYMGACGLALSPDEQTLYCAGWEEGDEEIWGELSRRPFLSVINRASMTETRRIQLNFAGWPRGIAVSPDGTRVYVANPFAGDYGALMQMWEGDISPVFGMIHVVSTVTNTEIDTDGVAGNGISPIIPEATFVVSLAVSTDGGTLYAGHGGSEFLEFMADPYTPNVSTFNTETFVEGAPLFSLAGDWYTTSAPNMLFDHQRGLLYAPRANLGGEGRTDGLSIFDPFIPFEALVDTAAVPSNNWTMRDVDLLWGTGYVVLADNGRGIVVVDVEQREAVGSAVASTGGKDIATIPPSRH